MWFEQEKSSCFIHNIEWDRHNTLKKEIEEMLLGEGVILTSIAILVFLRSLGHMMDIVVIFSLRGSNRSVHRW